MLAHVACRMSASHEADEASQRRFAAAAIPATKLNSAWWKPTEYIGAVLDGMAT